MYLEYDTLYAYTINSYKKHAVLEFLRVLETFKWTTVVMLIPHLNCQGALDEEDPALCSQVIILISSTLNSLNLDLDDYAYHYLCKQHNSTLAQLSSLSVFHTKRLQQKWH